MSKNNGKHKTTKRSRTLRIIVAVLCVVMALLLLALLMPWQAIIAELSPPDSSENNHDYDYIYYMQAGETNKNLGILPSNLQLCTT